MEDHPQVLALICHVLGRAGHVVLSTQSGAEGIRLLEEGDGHIDVLLCDHGLPDVTGVEVARRGLASQRGLRVLLMSGLPATELDDLGAFNETDVMEKPFEIQVLKDRIVALLESKGA